VKGIILAGGSGTRLYPVTRGVSKQLVPIYDKPMVYYPLSVLMLAGLKEILVITTPEDQEAFKRLLGDGSQWGIKFSYASQPKPDGLAQALIIAKDFLAGQASVLVLGDNIFYGQKFSAQLHRVKEGIAKGGGATVFATQVKDPERYGVVEFGADGQAVSLEEKPKTPRSHFAVTGLYFYDSKAPEMAASLKPSPRGELEITDLNRLYLEKKALKVEILGRGFAWLDTGTHESMLEAGNFIQAVSKRQGLQISCPEEIAFRMGWITPQQLSSLAMPMQKNDYGQYLLQLAEKGA
jgi:glucose-1-phosphate thymidylyltransferase